MKKLLLLTAIGLLIGCNSDDATQENETPRTTCYEATNQINVPNVYHGKWKHGLFDELIFEQNKIFRAGEQIPNPIGEGFDYGSTSSYYVQLYKSDMNIGEFNDFDYYYVRLVYNIASNGRLRHFYRLYDENCYEVHATPILYFDRVN